MYEEEIQPRISDAFAGRGMTFSTQRARAQSDVLGDISVAGQSELARGVFGNQALEAQLAEGAANRQLQAYGVGMSPLGAALGYTSQQQMQPMVYFPQQQQQSSGWPAAAGALAGVGAVGLSAALAPAGFTPFMPWESLAGLGMASGALMGQALSY